MSESGLHRILVNSRWVRDHWAAANAWGKWWGKTIGMGDSQNAERFRERTRSGRLLVSSFPEKVDEMQGHSYPRFQGQKLITLQAITL